MVKINVKYYFCTDCNLNCVYCNIVEPESESSSITSINKLVDFIIENTGRIENIIIFGGEPLQLKYKERLKKELSIIRDLKDNETTITIITNGYDNNIEDKINLTKELIDIYPELILVTSWDGFSTNKAKIEFIKRLSYNITRINYVINDCNYNIINNDIDKLDSLLNELPKNLYNSKINIEPVILISSDEPKFINELDTFKNELINLYLKYPHMNIFSSDNLKMCTTEFFDGIEEAQTTEIFKGEIYKSCIGRYNYDEEIINIIKAAKEECKECNVRGCLLCPSRFGKLLKKTKTSIKDNYYCKINHMIDDIRNDYYPYIYLKNRFKDFTNKPSIELILTSNCNMRCKYCQQGSHDNGKTMSIDTLDKSIDFIKYLDFKNILLFGGEPIMQNTLPLINHLIERLENEANTYSFDIVTNAYQVNDEIINTLNKLNTTQKINKIQISLDGIQEIHDMNRVDINGNGTFNTVINNIKRYRNDLNIENISTNSVITIDNCYNLPNFLLLLMELKKEKLIKYSSFRFDILERDPLNQDQIKHMKNIFHKIYDMYEDNLIDIDLFKSVFNIHNYDGNINEYGCGICNNFISISPSGSIIPCHAALDIDKNKESLVLGSVLSEPVLNKDSILLIKQLGSRKEVSSVYGDCKDCNAKGTCITCKLSETNKNYLTSSIQLVPESLCQYTKLRFEALRECINYDITRFTKFTNEEREDFLKDLKELGILIEENKNSLDNDEYGLFELLISLKKTLKERG